MRLLPALFLLLAQPDVQEEYQEKLQKVKARDDAACEPQPSDTPLTPLTDRDLQFLEAFADRLTLG